MSNKTIYEERADDLRILSGKEPTLAAETDRIKRPVIDAAQWHGGKWGTVVPAEFASRLERERDAMQEEIARLREDAARYRWAKDNLFIGYINDDVCSPYYDDELIDLARKETK